VAQERNVEPAAAPRPPGDGAEFLAAPADLIARRIERLGGKRAAAHSRDVRLGNADHAIVARRRLARAGPGSAGVGVRRRDERVGAVIDLGNRDEMWRILPL